MDHPFPRAARYDATWAAAMSRGENVLCLAEAAMTAVRPQPDTSVLDAGCGTGLSSLFLAKEYGLRVVGIDQDIDTETALDLAERFEVDHMVTFVQGDVLHLRSTGPLLLCLDSFYDIIEADGLGRLMGLIPTGGRIVIVDAAFERFPEPSEMDALQRRAWEEDYHDVQDLDGVASMLEDHGLVVEQASFLDGSAWLAREHARQHDGELSEAAVIAFQATMPVGTAIWVALRK